MKYVIVGGVAGGATVAARLRRMDEKAEIILFERGKYVSYANCGLPYYIGGAIRERSKLFVQTVQGFTSRFRIDIRTGQEVTRLYPAEKAVEVKELSSGRSYRETYDKLVLSPGAEPLRPGIEGIESPEILTLRNVPDTDAIAAWIEAKKPKQAVVVGGGFIGLEMAENLRERGMGVAVVEMAPQVMAPLDYSMAAIVHQHLAAKEVDLRLADGVARFERGPEGLRVHLKSGRVIPADLVILCIGVRPETRLAKEAGLAIGPTGGIAVNEYMQTSEASVYAVGDAVEVRHRVTGKPALIPLAGPANKQGRIAADNIVFGNRNVYKGSLGTSIAKVFDLTVAAVGANAKLLRREGIPYRSSYTHGASHAGYYPGAVPLSIKILFAPDSGRLLGAQVVGFDGVDKRIEMLAGVMQREGTVYDLAELEQAYAPPFAAAKDPVNMAGFVAENILEKKVRTLHWREVATLPADTVRVDVRTRQEYELGSIPGFINIPVDELRERLGELPAGRPVVVTCAVGLRGYLAYRILTQNGFEDVRNLSGGYKTWQVATAGDGRAPKGDGASTADGATTTSEGTTAANSQTVSGASPTATNLQTVSAASPAAAGATPSCTAKEAAEKAGNDSEGRLVEVDACGLMCPGPVMQLKRQYEQLAAGHRLRIRATDQAFARDVASWCKLSGAQLVSVENRGGVVTAVIGKEAPAGGRDAEEAGEPMACMAAGRSEAAAACRSESRASAFSQRTEGYKQAGRIERAEKPDHKTLIVFSDDLDKALASFVIANGAAATGKKVTMFFTFWGLNVIKKRQKPAVSKDFFGRMFGWMLPAHSGKLKLSKLNMGGAGSRMMRMIMQRKRIESLESLMASAVEAGVEMIACTMSMDVMGVGREELLDTVSLGGVATYLERAEEANVNLFI